MKYALVMPGETRVFDVQDSTFDVAPPFTWVGADDAVETSWLYNGSTVSAPAEELLEDAKDNRQAYINQRRDAAMLAPVTYDSNSYDVSPQTRNDLTSSVAFLTAAEAASFPGLPATISWRDATNVDRDLDMNDLIGLAAAMFASVQTAHATARALKDSIESATTVAAVNAIDWP